MSELWLRCSACRKDIGYSTVHWVCSVSTCNRSRTRLVFCSVACWDSHVATLRHRDAWAVEARSPTRAQWQAEQAQVDLGVAASPRPAAPAPIAPASSGAPSAASTSPAEAVRRRVVAESVAPPVASGASTASAVVGAAPSAAPSVTLSDEVERDILVVVSKLKKYIRDRSGMNCSDAVAEVLSDHLRLLCDQSIRAAAADSRKTVLDRDVPRPR